MRENTSLLVLTATGSALCWWPAIIDPSINFSRWLLLVPIAMITVLSTTLDNAGWLRLVAASSLGTFAGLCSGFVIWPEVDEIAAPFDGIAVVAATFVVVLVSLAVGLAGRKLAVSNRTARRTVWAALVCCVAIGPVTLALTPALVAHRMARNDRLAAQRFQSLRTALEKTSMGVDDSEQTSSTSTAQPVLINRELRVRKVAEERHMCDGAALRRDYSGPPFSEEDWRQLDYSTGEHAKQDGYVFIVHCYEKRGYAIGAFPARPKGEGTRRFCTNESGQDGCDLRWNGSRYFCAPCVE